MLKLKHSKSKQLITIVFLFIGTFIFSYIELSNTYLSLSELVPIILQIKYSYKDIKYASLRSFFAGIIFFILLVIYFSFFSYTLWNGSRESLSSQATFSKSQRFLLKVLNYICLLSFLSYLILALVDMSKGRPSKCWEIRQNHDEVFQSWTYEFREYWEKKYDTSYNFYQTICSNVFYSKRYSTILSTVCFFSLFFLVIHILG